MAHRKQDTMASGPADTGPEALGRQVCLRLLTVAPRTRAQLADAMRRRGVSEDVSDAILDRFTDAGLIDDAAFAKAWVESRHYARGLSRRSLSAELRRRGVDGDDITEAVEALDPEQEIETARQLVARKLRSTRGQPADARARRVASMLARKGYPAGLAFRLIREALEQEGSGGFAGSDGFDADGLGAELSEAETSEAETSEVEPG
jgi:regulatory protein